MSQAEDMDTRTTEADESEDLGEQVAHVCTTDVCSVAGSGPSRTDISQSPVVDLSSDHNSPPQLVEGEGDKKESSGADNVMGIPNVDFIEALGQVQDEKVKAAIQDIMKDPSKILDVIKSIENNQEVLGKVTSYIENNQQLRNMLTNMMQNNPQMKSKMNSMSLKEKRALMKKMRQAKNSLKAERNSFRTSRITSSRQLKTIEIDDSFPDGTQYVNNEPYEITEGVFMYYNQQCTATNKRVTKHVGFKVGGEVVFLRMNVDGDISAFTNDDYLKTFGKK